jgi:hypothetical protein
MSGYTFKNGRVHVNVYPGHETTLVGGYVLTRNGGRYRTHNQRYSGYTLSECLCKALIALKVAADWPQAIDMIESAGIPYVTDEDEDY